MKTPFKTISLITILTLGPGVIVFTSGCAATPSKESTGEYIDNSSITAKIKTAFVNDPIVSVLDIKVESFKGVVQLSGFVATAAEKAQAGHLATTVMGVTDVKNNIIIK